jgi:hypothetical protein
MMLYHYSGRRALLWTLMFLAAIPQVEAQSLVSATLSATIDDPSGKGIAGAHATLTHLSTNLKREATASPAGVVQIPFLPPGKYALEVNHAGFRPLRVPEIVLESGDQTSLQLQMELGTAVESVTVVDSPMRVQETGSVGTVVDHQFAENLPLNGRTLQPLILLAPGVVLAAKSNVFDSGDFTANGQRPTSNYLTVDGVSANLQANAATTATGPGVSGQAPSYNLFGGTNSLVSADAVLEMRIQTSTFAPEFGRTPGAQVSITTRSGTNEFHGSLFEYFRNNLMDANDWFANSHRIARAPLRQNQFGGVAGGPVRRNRTFAFVSYEGLRLRQPSFTIRSVPSAQTRASAPAPVRELISSWPLPNGPAQANGYGEYDLGYSTPTTMDAVSARLDHSFSEAFNVFARYNHGPTDSKPLNGGNAAVINPLTQTFETGTVGATWIQSPRIVHDVRFNYSYIASVRTNVQSDLDGAIPSPDNLMFSPAFTKDQQIFTLSLTDGGGNDVVGGGYHTWQHQDNLVETTSVSIGSHQFKFGVDYRRLTPELTRGAADYTLRGTLAAIVANNNLTVSVDAWDPLKLIFSNYSFFAQDTWKATPRLTLTYGLRYEVNPAPTPDGPLKLTPITSITNPTLGTPGDPVYKTTWNNVAPRFGASYLARQSAQWSTVVRGGIGVFYDFGYGLLSQSQSIPPYRRTTSYSNLSLPFDYTALPPATPNYNGTFADFFAVDPNLKMPYVPQWNVTIEQSLGAAQTLTLSYVGAIGRRLIRTEQDINASPQFPSIRIAKNTGTSDYDALQAQFRRRLGSGLQALLSYSWSKTIDTNYVDNWISASLLPTSISSPRNERGLGDFDARHSFSGAISYLTPKVSGNRMLRGLLNRWGVDALITARTSLPVDVQFYGQVGTVFYVLRPNRNLGVPIRISDPNVPAGWRINPAAFSTFTGIHQGSLGRNSVEGLPAAQVNFAMRRDFTLTEHLKLQFRGELFNVTNHPNFYNPGNNVTSSTFGFSTQMLSQGLGGVSPLYSVGGPRSVQLNAKLVF